MGVLDSKPLRAILGGLVAVAALGVLVGTTSPPQPNQSVTPVTPPLEYVTYDTHAATAQALEQLAAHLKPAPTATTQSQQDFFACIRWRESRNNYQAVNSTGTYRGAYQFYQDGWDIFAVQVAPAWVGIPPDQAPPDVQDAVALAAYLRLGARPWNGACQ